MVSPVEPVIVWRVTSSGMSIDGYSDSLIRQLIPGAIPQAMHTNEKKPRNFIAESMKARPTHIFCLMGDVPIEQREYVAQQGLPYISFVDHRQGLKDAPTVHFVRQVWDMAQHRLLWKNDDPNSRYGEKMIHDLPEAA